MMYGRVYVADLCSFVLYWPSVRAINCESNSNISHTSGHSDLKGLQWCQNGNKIT